MFYLYGDTGKISMKNIRANHPIILGLFSGQVSSLSSIGLAWRRSTRRRCPSPISC